MSSFHYSVPAVRPSLSSPTHMLCTLQVQDVFAAGNSSTPIVSKALTFIATEKNAQWLGKASLEDLAQQIATAEGPSGRNCDYLHQLAESLLKVRLQAHQAACLLLLWHAQPLLSVTLHASYHAVSLCEADLL